MEKNKTQTTIGFQGIDRFYKKHSTAILDVVNSVYQSGQILMGPEVALFEQNIAQLCDRKHGVAVNSCTDALFFALISAGINKGDEVLVTSFSFIASVTPILRVGAVPVFVDVHPDTCMMDLDDLTGKISERTKAILAVHLFGQMLPMDKLTHIASANNLVIIEDAAQSIGGTYQNTPAGNTGLISCLSFDPTKVIGGFGTAGVLLTDDKEIFQRVTRLRNHGKSTETDLYEELGYNSRVPTVQAALINMQLDLLDDWTARRRAIAQIYTRELSNLQGVKLLEILDGNYHTFHKYVIKVNDREELISTLQGDGIATQVHYKSAIFDYPLYEKFEYKAENLSVVHQVKNEVLSLPIYPELKDEEVEYVCKAIKSHYS